MAVAGLLLAACGAAPRATPTLPILPTHTATVTARPPTATATRTPMPPTATATETPTPSPTQRPHGTPDDELWEALQRQDYRIVTSAMTSGPEGYVYQAYLLTNPAYDSQMMQELTGTNHGVESGPGVCQVLFYRWDGDHYALIQSVGESETPIFCQAVNWDEPEYILNEAGRAPLKLHGYWSDINGNGLPEFAVDNLWCFACWWYDQGSTNFYEIQTPSSVADIVAGLNGSVVASYFFYAADPPTIRVYDVVGWHEEAVDFFWFYGWQVDHFVNVSTLYPGEYQAQIEQAIARIKAAYGKPFVAWNLGAFQSILILTENGGLPREAALQNFLDVTDMSHWPDEEPLTRCWLQLARAHAQMDFEQGVAFEGYSYFEMTGMVGAQRSWAEIIGGVDASRFDVSACKS